MCGKVLCSIAKATGGCTPVVYPTNYNVYSATFAKVRDELSELGLACLDNELPDIDYFYTDLKGWESIIPYLTYRPKNFIPSERNDCDNVAMQAEADSSSKFGLLALRSWGWRNTTYHAFNIVKIFPGGYRLFEPNGGFSESGKLFNLDNEYGYKAEKWKH